jgi:hypothetical protein
MPARRNGMHSANKDDFKKHEIREAVRKTGTSLRGSKLKVTLKNVRSLSALKIIKSRWIPSGNFPGLIRTGRDG